jgi:hypothetical protein
MTAPDRIWAQKPDIFDNCALWQDIPSDRHEDTEYVRADLVAAMIRDAVEADLEACAKLVLSFDTNRPEDTYYNLAILRSVAAIRARKGGE